VQTRSTSTDRQQSPCTTIGVDDLKMMILHLVAEDHEFRDTLRELLLMPASTPSSNATSPRREGCGEEVAPTLVSTAMTNAELSRAGGSNQ
jgi:hypothetical protein